MGTESETHKPKRKYFFSRKMAFSISHTIHAYHIDLEFHRKNELKIHRIQANELINANNHEYETNTQGKKNTNNWREEKM